MKHVLLYSKVNGMDCLLGSDLPALESIDFGEWAANGRDDDSCELIMRGITNYLLFSRSSKAEIIYIRTK